MVLRKFLGQLRQQAVLAVHRRMLCLVNPMPTVSFTFDDFPQSALSVGGAILRSYGIRGTYYAAMGLMARVNELGPQFCADDLETLLRDGHELGSHTFGHVSSRISRLCEFEADVQRGRVAVERITGTRSPHHFSYPYGHATRRAKMRIGAQVSSCRGIAPGVNASPVDLNLLRANSLYSQSFDLKALDRLFAKNAEHRGWLIFYTHDLSSSPSAYGCTPSEFESVVKLAVGRSAAVLPVGQVIAGYSVVCHPRVQH